MSNVSEPAPGANLPELKSTIHRFVALGEAAVALGHATWTSQREPFVLTLHGRGAVPERLVLGTLVHGNEFGPLEPVVSWLEGLVSMASSSGAWPLVPTLQVVVANVSAAYLGRRFVDEDLNRLFGDEQGQSPGVQGAAAQAAGPASHERRLAQVLRAVLQGDDLVAFVDLHQTIEATDRAFFIFGFHGPSLALASDLAPGVASTLVTRPPGQAFVAGQRAADEWVRLQGRPAVTIELGQKGWNRQTSEGAGALTRNLGRLLGDAALWESRRATWAVQHAKDWLTGAAGSFDVFTVAERLAFDGTRTRLREGLRNFAPVAQGEVLGLTHAQLPLRSNVTGLALFPKYPERDGSGAARGPLPGDILNIVRRVTDAELHEWASPLA